MSRNSGPSTLSVNVPDTKIADDFTNTLQDFCDPPPLAVSQFEIQIAGQELALGWRVDAYFESEPDLVALTRTLSTHVEFDFPELCLTPTPDLNWVAISQAALPPVQAGRFLVHGSHDRKATAWGPNAIEINASEAFGTAHHATTYLCLEAIDKWTRRKHFQQALDLGCGSGVLAIALARVAPKCRIVATDIDEKAIEVTRHNALINRVGGRIKTKVANGLSMPELKRPATFDFILANILAAPLIEISRDISCIAKRGAIVVLSGLLTRQAAEVTAAYGAAKFTLLEHHRRGEWSALVLRKS